jgi:hypothetical protein
MLKFVIKQWPEDFEVREIGINGDIATIHNPESNLSNWSDELIKIIQVDNHSSNDVVKHFEKFQTCNRMLLPDSINNDLLSINIVNKLETMNSWIGQYYNNIMNNHKNMEVDSLFIDLTIKMYSNRENIYNYINHHFSYLITRTISIKIVASENNNSCNNYNNNQYKIKVDIDLTFIDLFNLIPLEDIKKLYKFKNYGPTHMNADKGVYIGDNTSTINSNNDNSNIDNVQGIENIHINYMNDKDLRTKIYKIITSKCKFFDSKTVEKKKVTLLIIYIYN